jgi:ribose 5-phosphate isomerase B
MQNKNLTIGIASDHAGFKLKQQLIKYMRNTLKLIVIDHGADNEKSVDYPDFAAKIIVQIESGDVEYGILICGSGIGMSICANRSKHVRGAICNNREVAKLARQHNDANVLILGARVVSFEDSKDIVRNFFASDFEGGRHAKRIAKINLHE